MPKESPLFVKTFDVLKWVLGRTEKFPKSQRFFLAKRVNDAIFDFYETIVDAAMLKDSNIKARLKTADACLLKLRHYLRLSNELGYLSFRQYEYVTTELSEAGRLLGGWLRKAG